MNVLVLGASGRTGRLLVELAVARSHHVTVLVRPDAATRFVAPIRIVIGDPTQLDAVAASIDGQDAVISCLGQRSAADAKLLRTAATAAVGAMQTSSTQRYLVLSQGLMFPSRNPVIKLLRVILKRHLVDSTAMEDVVRASGLEWTIARPPRLLEGGKAQGYRATVDARPAGKSSMQRADLASYLLDAVEQRMHLRSMVGVTGA